MKNEIENIFKQKFNSFEATPSAGLFGAIIAKKAKKKRAIWMWSTAALLVTASALGLWSYTNNTPLQLAKNTIENTDKSIPTLPDPIHDKKDVVQDNSIIEKPRSQTNLKNKPGGERIKEEIAVKRETRTLKTEAKTQHRHNKAARTNTNSKNKWAELFAKIDMANPTMDLDKGTLYHGNKKQTIDKSAGLNIPQNNKTRALINSAKDHKTENNDRKQTLNSTLNTITSVTIEQTPKVKEEEDIEEVILPLPTGRLVALNKWRIQASVGMGYASRTLSETNKEYIDLRNSTENVAVSYQFGANVIYQFSPRWNIQTGLQYTIRNELFEYSEQMYTTEKREVQRTETVVHPVLGEIERTYLEITIDTTSQYLKYTSSQNKFQTVSIPIIVERELFKHHSWSLLAKVGVHAGIYSNRVGLLLAPNKETQEYTTLPTRNTGIASAMFGTGVLYSVTPRISLLAYPQVNLQLNSSTKRTAGFSQNDWGIYTHVGLRIGL
ncbi:PorT family protein [Bacteroidia bacterium]|nr:PorT family protein [Bacteroidia bacterium]